MCKIIKHNSYVQSPGFSLPTEDKVERSGYIPLERQIDMQRLAGQRLRRMHEALAAGEIPFDDTAPQLEDVVYDADDPLDIAMVACAAGEEIERYNHEYETIVASGQHPFIAPSAGDSGVHPVVSDETQVTPAVTKTA